MVDRALTAICTYRVKPGREDELLRLLARHWPTLHRLGLVTDEPPRRFRGLAPVPGPYRPVDERTIVELLVWKSAEASAIAHRHPEVLSIWEPMILCCDSIEVPNFVALDEANPAR